MSDMVSYMYNAWAQVLSTSPLEWLAVISGMLSVILANRNNAGLYPAGILSTSIFIYLMASVGLYAESLLNGYYLVMSIYGWMLWLRKRDSSAPSGITVNSSRDWMITGGIVAGGSFLLYFILARFTDSQVPVADAVVSSTAWAGMWLLAKHKVENWILLNISNLIAIPLLIYKGLPLTAGLTVFLFIVAVWGYFRWRHIYLTQKKRPYGIQHRIISDPGGV